MPAGCMLLNRYARVTVTVPRAPSPINSRARRKASDDRRWMPTWTTRAYRRAAATIFRPSTTVIESGFSTYTSLPASQAAII